jgi:hypothetical protein
MKQLRTAMPGLARVGVFAVALAIVAAASPAHALTFDITWDSSMSSFGANETQAEADILDVTALYSELFTNPVTLNITIAAAADPSFLGESDTNVLTGFSYSQVQSALVAHASTPASIEATSALPLSEPASGTGAGFQVAVAEAEALGLTSNESLSAGTVTLSTYYNWALDPNAQAVPGDYSIIGTAEHEISEVMGRTTNLSSNNGTEPNMPVDLLRCVGGSIDMSPSASSVYFSTDGCHTAEQTYNSNPSGDLQDWAGSASYPVDAYDAYGTTGVDPVLSQADVDIMNSLGYEAPPVPEPASFALLLPALAGLIFLRRRKVLAG